MPRTKDFADFDSFFADFESRFADFRLFAYFESRFFACFGSRIANFKPRFCVLESLIFADSITKTPELLSESWHHLCPLLQCIYSATCQLLMVRVSVSEYLSDIVFLPSLISFRSTIHLCCSYVFSIVFCCKEKKISPNTFKICKKTIKICKIFV